jgi:hypothetical protein
MHRLQEPLYCIFLLLTLYSVVNCKNLSSVGFQISDSFIESLSQHFDINRLFAQQPTAIRSSLRRYVDVLDAFKGLFSLKSVSLFETEIGRYRLINISTSCLRTNLHYLQSLRKGEEWTFNSKFD